MTYQHSWSGLTSATEGEASINRMIVMVQPRSCCQRSAPVADTHVHLRRECDRLKLSARSRGRLRRAEHRYLR
ncbi:hypothetical protein KCP76_12815 [Salmonella enterica subsp. enterica serovar Weltevreden]|nr:hypothetical protein KCP76_12815 [Salmonella enterica subsp. enterica serovar Weltevreden]